MDVSAIGDDDVGLLADMLEREKRHHCHVRTLCLTLFSICFAVLLVSVAGIAVLFATNMVRTDGTTWLTLLQVLAPLSAAMIWFFASWCSAHNCVSSIDRSIYAARAGRKKLFVGLVGHMQCTSKSKRAIWVEMLGSVVA